MVKRVPLQGQKKKKELQVNKQINQLLEAGTIILSLSGGQRSSPQKTEFLNKTPLSQLICLYFKLKSSDQYLRILSNYFFKGGGG